MGGDVSGRELGKLLLHHRGHARARDPSRSAYDRYTSRGVPAAEGAVSLPELPAGNPRAR